MRSGEGDTRILCGTTSRGPGLHPGPGGVWRCCVLRDPEAPTAHPSDHAVLWFLAVPCGVQPGSPVGKARHAIPVAAEWLNLEHPLQAVSACHFLCQHRPRAWPLLDPAVGISGTLGKTEGWGVAFHRTPSHIKSTVNNMSFPKELGVVCGCCESPSHVVPV